MTLQELNDYIQDIIADSDLQETCKFWLNPESGDWFQTWGREEGDLIKEGIYIDKYDTIIIMLNGGRNGDGRWVDYLNGLATILENIEKLPEVDEAYIVDIIDDCPDDVFNLRIAIRPTSEGSFEE